MATRLVLVAPCGIKRVNGTWEPLGPVEQVPPDWAADADPVPDGEPAGVGGRYAYPRGYRFEITPETRDAIADIESLAFHSGSRCIGTVCFGDWVRTEEIPVPIHERIVSRASPMFTPAQEQEIARLMEAKLAELGIARPDVA